MGGYKDLFNKNKTISNEAAESLKSPDLHLCWAKPGKKNLGKFIHTVVRFLTNLVRYVDWTLPVYTKVCRIDILF